MEGRKKLYIYTEGGEKMIQIAQRDDRSSIPEAISGQIVWGSEQPALLADCK